MVREPKLIKYLPQYVQEYEEIEKIMSAETPEIKLTEDETEVTKDAAFILYAGEGGIKHFERLLSITPLSSDTLEARRSRVLTRWNIAIPYTYRELIRRLNQLCGEGNYTLTPNFNEYELEITADLPKSGQVDELKYLLDYMLPANINVITRNEMTRNISGYIRGGGCVVESTSFTIQTLLNGEYDISTLLTNAGAVTTTKVRMIN